MPTSTLTSTATPDFLGSSSTTPYRIMLIDDHAVTRAGYRFLLESLPDMQVVSEASNGEEALALMGEVLPDIAILDLSMPGISGRDLLVLILQRWPTTKVLICSMHETAAMVDHVLQAGASGYISKNSSPEVLVTAVRQIAGGHRYVDADLARSVMIDKTVDVAGNLTKLTPREFEILCLYAEAKTVDAIANQLSLSSKTVANNLTIIKDKLQVASTAELVRLAISKGLVSI
jgi:two-component system, NarL family, invasion response regulator UvrY